MKTRWFGARVSGRDEQALLAGESLDVAFTKAGCAQKCLNQPALGFPEWMAHAVKIALVTGAGLFNNDDDVYNDTGASA